LRVLVMGGSRGAAALNERVPQAMARLAQSAGPLSVVHQAGREQDAAVRRDYDRLGVPSATVVPFIDDVARALAEADLVIARAGAVTVAEITAIGRASILVPFPHATDDHQRKNAEALERMGATRCLRQDAADPERLAREMGRLLSDASLRGAMAEASQRLGRPNAARDVALDLLKLSGVKTGATGVEARA